jgi:hypothetical protein
MVAVVAGELRSPLFTGLIYCGTIDVCQEICEWRRTREWTAALTQWCEAQPDMVSFTGQCLVHRAEILQMLGSWRTRSARRGARVSASCRLPTKRPLGQRSIGKRRSIAC